MEIHQLRLGRTLKLTGPGQLFLPRARAILNELSLPGVPWW